MEHQDLLTEIKDKKVVIVGEELPNSDVTGLMQKIMWEMQRKSKLHVVLHWFSFEMQYLLDDL
jgi:uncharacterized iron-regulated protein